MHYNNVDTDIILKLYLTMERIRRFELRAVKLYMDGEIPGFLHSCLGQEATAAGVCAHLKKDDYITSTHRGHGHVIAKGADLKKMMAELYGKATGYCSGKGGSMHIMDSSIGILGANGIVGGGLPIATGAALSSKMRKTEQVTVCFFGDGASNQGTFHESLNLAAVWELPIVYACENNCYAESTPQCEHQKIKNIADRAQAYSIHSDIVNGNDVLDVYDKTEAAVERARKGKGPTLLEFKTYRWLGHYVGDPGVYRPKEEVERWKSADPLKIFKENIIADNILPEQKLQEITEMVDSEIEEAVKFAINSPDPDFETALQDLYAD